MRMAPAAVTPGAGKPSDPHAVNMLVDSVNWPLLVSRGQSKGAP